MEIPVNMRCIFCCGSGKNCSYCGYRKKKRPKSNELSKYGCHCHKNQYCNICRTEKVTEKGIKDREEFLEKTWLKLKKYQMVSTGSAETDIEILDMFG